MNKSCLFLEQTEPSEAEVLIHIQPLQMELVFQANVCVNDLFKLVFLKATYHYYKSILTQFTQSKEQFSAIALDCQKQWYKRREQLAIFDAKLFFYCFFYCFSKWGKLFTTFLDSNILKELFLELFLRLSNEFGNFQIAKIFIV